MWLCHQVLDNGLEVKVRYTTSVLCSEKKKHVISFFPSSSCSWNGKVMAGTGADISDHETEATCEGLQSKNTEGGWASAGFTEKPTWTFTWRRKKRQPWASLVAQWLRVCLLMQGTQVRALVWEDPTCRGAAGPVSHNCRARASGACAPQQRGRHSERPAHRDEEWPPLAATRESPCTETKTQHSHK